MKISELIALLEQCKEEFGDLEVKLYDPHWLEANEITSADFVENDDRYIEIY